MHATIALCLMMVGGPVAPPPEAEIMTVPLKDDLNSLANMQDLEWKTRGKLIRLPRVPTLADDRDQKAADDNRSRRYVPPTDPNAPKKPQPVMPVAPTDPGSGQTARTGGGPMPAMPSAGSPYGQAASPNRPQFGGGGGYSQPVKGNYGGTQIQTAAPTAVAPPQASNTLSNIYYQNNINSLGVPSNPFLSQPTGTPQKAYSNYQSPSGYSPWMNLYSTRTNGGTVDPYYSSVQPALQQIQYNRQVAEQIQGVRNAIVAPQSSSSGVEVSVGGAGLANPAGFLDYTPQMNH